MVEFENQIKRQVVPEWKDSYVNYKQLKQELKKIRGCSEKQTGIQQQAHINQNHGCNILSPKTPTFFQDTMEDLDHFKHQIWSTCSHRQKEMIKFEVRDGGDNLSEMQVLHFRTDMEKAFFWRLNTELEMVNTFYRCKEQEYLTWASQLQLQLDILSSKKRFSCKRVDDSSSAEDINEHSNIIQVKNHELGVKGDDLHYMCKSKINRTEKILRDSFTELYNSLWLLKNYSSLNIAIFGKILKKYDKITGQKASDVYLRSVECSYFANLDKIIKVMDKIELLFTEHFTKNNHREALAYLKPVQQQRTSQKLFFLGLFSGSSIILFVIFILLITLQHRRNLLTQMNDLRFDFYASSTLGLIFLHLYIFGFNIFFWQRFQISHTVILDFKPGKKLGFSDILILSTAFTTILLAGMVMQLVFYDSDDKTSVLPFTIMLVFCCIFLILPIDICYKSIRFTFLQQMWHIICSPLYKVNFPDFFLADQLTSQITTFRSSAWILCYYICRDFVMHETASCQESNMLFQEFAYFVSVLPYWWRLMQCLRSWMDNGDQTQIANGGKYLSAIVAILTRVTFQNNDSVKWLIIFVLSSAFATCYQLYWDVVVDWGLLQPKSANSWLRDKLTLRQRYIYFIAMGMNLVLRLAWLFSLLHLKINWIDRGVVEFLFASLEVFRRGLWNFFRLENEHLKRMARQHWTVKAVPSDYGNLESEHA